MFEGKLEILKGKAKKFTMLLNECTFFGQPIHKDNLFLTRVFDKHSFSQNISDKERDYIDL